MKRILIPIVIIILLLSAIDDYSFCRASNRELTLLTELEMKASIDEYFKALMPAEILRHSIEVKNLPKSITIPPGNVRLEIKSLSNRKLKGNVIIQLLVLVNQKCCKKIVTSVKIRTYENVVVAHKSFSRHEKTKTNALTIECRETTVLNRMLFHSLEQLEGFRTKRFVPAGSIITGDKVEPVPLVNRGDIVTLVVQYQNLYVTARGKALKNGHENEIIEVKNLDSNKRLKGRVIDQKKVLVMH